MAEESGKLGVRWRRTLANNVDGVAASPKHSTVRSHPAGPARPRPLSCTRSAGDARARAEGGPAARGVMRGRGVRAQHGAPTDGPVGDSWWLRPRGCSAMTGTAR